MRRLPALVRREVKGAFLSPVAWSLIAIFLLVSGYFFYSLLYLYGMESFEKMRLADTVGPQELTVGRYAVRPLVNNIGALLLMFLPLVTMRLFAEEKRSGSIEMLFTWPLTDVELTLGKYLAALTVYAAMLAPTLLFPWYLSLYGPTPWGHVLTAWTGLFLMGAAFIALGLFISSLTENQVVAGAVTFGALLLFWIVAWTVGQGNGALEVTIRYLSILEHLDPFAKGALDSRDIIYYASFIGLFLFLTLRSLESKGWRG